MIGRFTQFLIIAGMAIGDARSAGADCREHISRAEASYAIPAGLMDAVGYVESGYDPLSINADGMPYHPATIDEAVNLVERLQRQGARYIDVGCMQVDLHYHPDAFADLRAAFDPSLNTAYGAQYLRENWTHWGTWTQAVGYYHSADPGRQADYVARVKARLTGATLPRSTTTPALTASSSGPKMVTVHLAIMTVRRPLAGTTAQGSE